MLNRKVLLLECCTRLRCYRNTGGLQQCNLCPGFSAQSACCSGSFDCLWARIEDLISEALPLERLVLAQLPLEGLVGEALLPEWLALCVPASRTAGLVGAGTGRLGMPTPKRLAFGALPQ